MKRVAEGAAELTTLLQSYCALTECATRACDSGDLTALAGALDGRDHVQKRIAPLMREVMAARRAAPNERARADIDRLLMPSRAVSEEARRLGLALEERANAARADIGAQLARLSHDDSARSAYAAAAAPHGDSLLDLRR